jgi:hypothetical protein
MTPAERTSRAAELAALREAASAGEWPLCAERAYRALHGLPATVQIAAAAAAVLAALRLFEARHPGFAWANVAQDPAGWVAAHGRELPGAPLHTGPGDGELEMALDALLISAAYPRDERVLAAASATAMAASVDARGAWAWAANDPEAAAAWGRTAELQEEDAEAQLADALAVLNGRTVLDNPAASRARALAWAEAADALEAAGAASHPGPYPARMERDLAEWLEREMMPIVPGSATGETHPEESTS